MHVLDAAGKLVTMDIFEMRRRVTEADVAALVDRFYDRVRETPSLAPVFDARIEAGAWPEHLSKMRAFWSTVLLGSGRYRGNPMTTHQAIADITREHFADWLGLFEVVVGELFAEDVARAIVQRARRMGDSLTASLRL